MTGSTINTAIILAAGMGSRLRAATPFKPLCPVAGSTLLDHAIDGLATAGIGRVVVVLGYGADSIVAHLATRAHAIPVAGVLTDPSRPNGVSALAARDWVEGEEALLVMADHLVDPALYARVRHAGAGAGLTLGVDRRLGHPWVDPLDVTCVATRDEAIIAIGKGLEPHDCYDTGVFAVGPALFKALAAQRDPSLTEGVRALAKTGQARALDCGEFTWIDVDDQKALAQAEGWLGQPEALCMTA